MKWQPFFAAWELSDMAEFVVIRLARDHGPLAEWIVADDNGTRRSQPSRGALEEAAAIVQGRPVIVLLPATETLTTVVSLPMRAGAKLNAALPYALEEQVAVDVDTMHFAAGDKRDSGIRPVAAVAREQMDRWLTQLAEAGIVPWKMVPENYGLARIPGTMSVLVDDDCVFFNDGDDTEFVMQGATPSDALVASGKLSDKSDDDAPPEQSGHLVVYCDAADEERLSHDWIALRHELHSVDLNLLPDGALPRLAVTVASGQGVNLLQGQYGPKADYGSWLRPWSKAAMLLLGFLVLLFAGKGVDYYRLTQEEAALRDQFAQAYRQLRPEDAGEIADPVQRVNSLKRSLGTGTAPQVFLPSLLQLSAAMSGNPEATIEALSYRAGAIDIQVNSPDVETVGRIQEAVSASGQYEATIQSTNQADDRIDSRIQIRETGS